MSTSTEAITYSFVQFYYQKLHEDPTKLYQIYTPNAKLTHSKIPHANESLETSVLSNKDEIEKFYADSTHFSNSKVRIFSIDSQSVFEGSILINVIGELALTDDSPVFRFTQSFVLTPGSVANSYDITNDIFRLILDDDFELGHVEEESEEKATEETAAQAGESVADTAQSNGTAREGPKVHAEEETPEAKKAELADEVKLEVEEVKEEEKPADPAQEVVGDAAEEEEKAIEDPKPSEVEAEPKEEKKEVKRETAQPEVEEEPKREEKPAKPAAPLSWAQVSITAKAKPVKAKEAKPAAPSTAASSTAPATAASSPPPPPPPAQAQAQAQPQAQAQAKPAASPASPSQAPVHNKTRKHLFPVIVNNINILKGPELKVAIEKEFGRTTKVEPKGHFGLIDFETKESQDKALERGKLKIGNSVVTFDKATKNVEFSDSKGYNKKNPATSNRPKPSNTKQQQQNGSANPKKKPAAK